MQLQQGRRVLELELLLLLLHPSRGQATPSPSLHVPPLCSRSPLLFSCTTLNWADACARSTAFPSRSLATPPSSTSRLGTCNEAPPRSLLPSSETACIWHMVGFIPKSQLGSLAVTPLRAASSFAPPLCRYAVAVSQGNAQAALAFQFLHEVVKVLKNYFGDFTEVRGACACACACA